jgi:hypothetical protein
MSLLKTAPGLAARAFDAVWYWAVSRIVQLGMVEDDLLNVLVFDGNADESVSVHTAEADGYRPNNVRVAKRAWWAEVGCLMLSKLVQANHCWCVENNVPMTAGNRLRACFFISWVLISPFLVHWWALVVDLLVIAPFAVAETVSRARAASAQLPKEKI